MHWLLPHKARWVLLLVASYYFYMSWNPWLVFLILGTTAVSYGAAILVARTKSKRLKKLWLVLTLVVCLGVLFVFKYLDFLIGSVIDFLNLFSLHLEGFALNLLLPVGISFYTFQTLSYVIDVYRGEIEPEYHFGYYALFVSFFPQLVAGPIERADSLIPQLKAERTLNTEDMQEGFRIALLGFFRKCVVADFCGIYVNRVFSDVNSANGLSVLLAGMLFNLQIYGDFAGYSEIAMGCARMLGVKLMKNFDKPYSSVSFTEFFRRWHISLNKWFTDYLYIPLGGNRKGKARKILNIFIVFALCGLWHGAGWTYVLWGLYTAVFMTIETLAGKPLKAFLTSRGVNTQNDILTAFRQAGIFLLMSFAGLIFRASSVEQLGVLIAKLFTQAGFGVEYFNATFSTLGLNAMSVIQLALALFAMCLMQNAVFENEQPVAAFLRQNRTLYAEKVSVYFYGVAAVALFWLLLASMGEGSAFLYFQF